MSVKKKIKEILKKILPPPVKAFMREVSNILYTVNKNKKELDEKIDKCTKEVLVKLDILAKEYSSITSKLDEHNTQIKHLYSLFESANRENLRIFNENKAEREQLLKSLLEKNEHLITEYMNTSAESLKTISSNVNKIISDLPERYMYNNDRERRVTVSFKEYRQRNNYPEKLLALLRGLDDESAATVTRILSRQEKIWGTEGRPINILTDEEIQQIRYLKQHLYDNILKISEDIYCYHNFLLPLKHFEPCVFVYRYGLDKLTNMNHFSYKCIIDAGAFIGDTALILAPLTSSVVYAFEATSKYFNLLQKTIEMNNLKNVVPIHAALGAKCGSAVINIAGSSSTILNTPVISEGSEEVEMITLDSFVDKFGLEVGLIKVDIEGYEREFLKGAEKTIREQRPTLIISIYHHAADFFDIKPIIESWNLEYRFKVYKPVDFSISREVLLIAEID